MYVRERVRCSRRRAGIIRMIAAAAAASFPRLLARSVGRVPSFSLERAARYSMLNDRLIISLNAPYH